MLSLPRTSPVPAPRGTGTKKVFEEAQTTNFRLLFTHALEVSVLVALAFILPKDISICKVRAIRFVPLDCVLIITWPFRYFPTVVAFDVRRTQPKLNPRETWARKWQQAFTSWVVAISFTEDWRRYFVRTCINMYGVIWVRLWRCFRRKFYRWAGDPETPVCVNTPVKSSWNLHSRQINTR